MNKVLSRGLDRSRWAAVGAAVAIALVGGHMLTASAAVDSGERAVYVPIAPCRVMDTRPAPDTVGSRSTPLGPGDTHSIQVRGANGNCTLPGDAAAVVMNVAVVAPTSASFLTVFPADVARPLAASLNWEGGDPPLSNAVTSDIAADGRVSFYNLAGTVHVAADIVGYYVDHTHDDRYYTKAAIDAQPWATIVANGFVDGIGNVDVRFEAPAGALTVIRVSVGHYRVTFARPGGPIPDWEVMAVVSPYSDNRIAKYDSSLPVPGGYTFDVRTDDLLTGVPADSNFTFIAFLNPV